jgi:outer membrane protein TolC
VKRIGIALLVFCGLPFTVSADLSELYRQRLEGSLEYRRAVLLLEQEELTLRQAEQFYVPYVDIGSGFAQSGSAAVTLKNGELAPISIALRARFINVLGTDIVLSLPFTYNTENGAGLQFPELAVSRELFPETKTKLLEARASVAERKEAVESARLTVWKKLIEEICDYAYYLEVLEIQSTYAETLRRQMDAAADEQTMRSLRRRWLTMRKNVLESESGVEGISLSEEGFYPEELDRLYGECLALIEELEKDLPGPDRVPEEDAKMLALRLKLEAARRQAKFWYRPYLPNPVFSGSITYDKNTRAVDWSLSLGFSVPIVDRGERSVQALSRKENVELVELELEREERLSGENAEDAWRRKEILSVDYQLAGLTVDENEEDAATAEALYREGFLSIEQLEMKQLEFRLAEAARTRSRNRYLLQLLDIGSFYGISVIPEEG